jgi:hypothetical protein
METAGHLDVGVGLYRLRIGSALNDRAYRKD